MISENHLSVTRTARYFTIGELSSDTKEIWIVLHGYAQLAKDFIRFFTPLTNGKRFIVAPEGLSRFYAKGFFGKPVANWMTSEDRQHEIIDYIHFLDLLALQLRLSETKAKIVILGFSQGVTTASRWIHHTNIRIHHFVICSGEIGTELREPISEKLKTIAITYITGNNDPLITPEKHQLYHQLMQSLKATIIEFNGGHEMNMDIIENVAHNLFAQ